MRPQSVYVSATPGPWEMERTGGIFAEQVIRPTGLIDPPVEVAPGRKPGRRPDRANASAIAKRGYRALVTTLTKKMAEDLTEYMHEQGIRVRYMHTRRGDPGADRDHPRSAPGRVRRADRHQPVARRPRHSRNAAWSPSWTPTRKASCAARPALVQTIGRAARNVDGKVILYADSITGSMERAMAETSAPPRQAGGLQHASTASRRLSVKQQHRRHHGHRCMSATMSRWMRALLAEERPRIRRPQYQGGDRGDREEDARRRRRPRIRGSGAAARRTQAAAIHRPGDCR